jgi:hypothetical protein
MIEAIVDRGAELFRFLRAGLVDFASTDFAQVHYGDVGTARMLGVVVLAAVGLAALRRWRWPRAHWRLHSGHAIDSAHARRTWQRVVYALPKIALGAAVALMIVAAAGPFLASTEEFGGSMDSRLRVDLIDVSGSMGWQFPGTLASKAQVAREAYLKFLEMRRGKNDRVSLWLFSSHPYMIDDFVTDDELYYFEALDAPYLMTQALDRAMIVPADKVRIIPAEGDSNIVRPLQAIVRQLDADAVSAGVSRTAPRALLVVTDAAVSELPESELAELSKRAVVPYVIYINGTNPQFASMLAHDGPPPLVEQIRAYGGDYFDARDPDALARAYAAIDAREAVRYEVRHRALRVPIHDRFLVASLMLLMLIIPAGMIAELLGGTYP